MSPRPTLQFLGCTLLPNIFPPTQLAPLIPLADDALRASSARAGARIPTTAPLVQTILAHAPFADAIATLGEYRPVRAIVFDKSPDHNWGASPSFGGAEYPPMHECTAHHSSPRASTRTSQQLPLTHPHHSITF